MSVGHTVWESRERRVPLLWFDSDYLRPPPLDVGHLLCKVRFLLLRSYVLHHVLAGMPRCGADREILVGLALRCDVCA